MVSISKVNFFQNRSFHIKFRKNQELRTVEMRRHPLKHRNQNNQANRTARICMHEWHLGIETTYVHDVLQKFHYEGECGITKKFILIRLVIIIVPTSATALKSSNISNNVNQSWSSPASLQKTFFKKTCFMFFIM